MRRSTSRSNPSRSEVFCALDSKFAEYQSSEEAREILAEIYKLLVTLFAPYFNQAS